MSEASEFFDSIPEAGRLTITGLAGNIEVGMLISFAGDPNRYRRRVVGSVTRATFMIKLFIRPSRGFARHNRKLKMLGVLR